MATRKVIVESTINDKFKKIQQSASSPPPQESKANRNISMSHPSSPGITKRGGGVRSTGGRAGGAPVATRNLSAGSGTGGSAVGGGRGGGTGGRNGSRLAGGRGGGTNGRTGPINSRRVNLGGGRGGVRPINNRTGGPGGPGGGRVPSKGRGGAMGGGRGGRAGGRRGPKKDNYNSKEDLDKDLESYHLQDPKKGSQLLNKDIDDWMAQGKQDPQTQEHPQQHEDAGPQEHQEQHGSE